MTDLKIAIIGASIAGSVCAILLSHLGFDINVFEQRSPGAMSDRGTGIGLPQQLVHQLLERHLIDIDFPKYSINKRQFFVYERELNKERLLTEHPIAMYIIHWGYLYQQLAKRLPQALVKYNHKLTHLLQENNKNILTFNNEVVERYDLVIFADGYDSIGRQFLFPEAKPTFANYIVWRGIVDGKNLSNNQRLIEHLTFSLYMTKFHRHCSTADDLSVEV